MPRVKSILIIDGDEAVVARLERALERGGWICVRTRNLDDAMEVLHTVRPAVVLVELAETPEGSKQLARLRGHPFMAGVPVALAAAGSPGARLPAGVDALIPASSQEAEIAARLDLLLEPAGLELRVDGHELSASAGDARLADS